MENLITKANEIKAGDTLLANGIVARVTEVTESGFVKNDLGQECGLIQLQMFIDKGVVRVERN